MTYRGNIYVNLWGLNNTSQEPVFPVYMYKIYWNFQVAFSLLYGKIRCASLFN